MLPFVFEDGFGFEAWVDYVLDVPMYFVYRDGKYIDALGQSFRDFLKGQLPALPGEAPTLSRLGRPHDHRSSPRRAIKKYIEMRGADGGPWRRLCALPALWVGLTYDQQALDAATGPGQGLGRGDPRRLRIAPVATGLQGQVGKVRSLHDLCARGADHRRAGPEEPRAPAAMAALVPDETHFLNALKESVESGKVPSDELLEKYRGEWAGDLSRIYDEYSY